MTHSADVVDLAHHRKPHPVAHIELLGPLAVTRAGSTVELTGPKRRALLTLLAMNLGKPVGRDQIIEALWPTRRSGREESTLRVHVSHLRDELEPSRDEQPSVLVTRNSAYMLSSESVSVDVGKFEGLRGEAFSLLEEDPERAVDLFNGALGLWRGRALQDVEYEDFAQDEIRRLDSARLSAIKGRAQALIATGEDAAAIQDLEPLVRDDPTDEGASALLMRALYRTGRQSEALRVSDRLTRHLRERGLEPSPRITTLEERILSHDPSLLPEGIPSSEQIKVGRSVRGYELREEVGRGSIGVVYRAFQPSVGREVAVKVIDPELAQSPEFVRRFAEEAKVIAGLEHPHIVPLHDFWREPNGAFLVMRWMDGGSMADRLGTPWEQGRLAQVFDQLAAALGYAHNCGVVHRDVKPENVLFDAEGNPYLCDFGLAAAGIETGKRSSRSPRSLEPPYASPELIRAEAPTVASDIYSLGVLLAEAASGETVSDARSRLTDSIWEVVNTAAAANPADRYPDMTAFRAVLREALSAQSYAAPKIVRRNPYKGLEPFEEIDNADFYGRDDVIESLLHSVASQGLVALIGSSGSGKSSVVRAGLIPQLRDGALPGSEQWSVVTMVPGDDPFEEFHLALRDAAIGLTKSSGGRSTGELRTTLLEALDSPRSHALLVIDQFEELFSSSIEEDVRSKFLDDLVLLASDAMDRFRIVLTMRADFSDRPLSHPTFGDLVARSSLLLGPMRPDQLEDVIRRPAARAGIQVEPGLISEIIRDVADAPAYLPLLQYVLAELFERRSEDRLTVQGYRSIGGVQAVVERTAESTYRALDEQARAACRQLFLRMVHLGEHGEETRRRLPLNEVAGLESRAAGEKALEAFASARLVAYDRDPVSRTPTVEVAHETVIERWTRYRVWIDEARTDLLGQRRVSAAAQTWVQSEEDPAYLLTGGPLTEALVLVANQRVDLNELETRFVEESREAALAADRAEVERRQHEENLEQRSRWRLRVGIGVAVVALVVGALAIVAWDQRQHARDLAAMQERESLARELAAFSLNSLSSEDPNLALLLAIAAAEETLDVSGEILPEAIDAMHRSLINPRPDRIVEGATRLGGSQSVDYSGDGTTLAVLAEDGGAMVIDSATGEEVGRILARDPRATGVEFHPRGKRVLTIHEDAVREWDWQSQKIVGEIVVPGQASITTAIYSNDGSRVAVGSDDGVIRVFITVSKRQVAMLEDPDLEAPANQSPEVFSLAFDPTGSLLASSTRDSSPNGRLVVWDVASGDIASVVDASPPMTPTRDMVWQPQEGGFLVVGATIAGEMWSFNGYTGEQYTFYGLADSPADAVTIDDSGHLVFSASGDGVARGYGAYYPGVWAELPSGGVPLRDLDVAPGLPTAVAVVGADGRLSIWSDLSYSELPVRPSNLRDPKVAATPDGKRYVVSGSQLWVGLDLDPWLTVFEAATGEPILSFPTLATNQPPVPGISADGSKVAFVGPEGDIEMADVDTASREVVVPHEEIVFESPIYAERGLPGLRLALSEDASVLAWSGPPDGIIRLWDTEEHIQIGQLAGHGDHVPAGSAGPGDRTRIERLVFRPGSRELASVGHDGTLRVWDMASGEGELFKSFDYEAHSVAYSIDGSLLAVSDRTGTVEVLDSDNGDLIMTPQSVSGPTWLRFSPDGRYLVGAAPGPYVHLWDLETGFIERRLEGSVYWPQDVVFINEGRQLLVMSTEGVMRGYHIDPEGLLEAARDAVDDEMTAAECQRYLRRSCDA